MAYSRDLPKMAVIDYHGLALTGWHGLAGMDWLVWTDWHGLAGMDWLAWTGWHGLAGMCYRLTEFYILITDRQTN